MKQLTIQEIAQVSGGDGGFSCGFNAGPASYQLAVTAPTLPNDDVSVSNVDNSNTTTV